MKELEKDMERNMKKRGEEFSSLLTEIEDKFVSKKRRMNNSLVSTTDKQNKSVKAKKRTKK